MRTLLVDNYDSFTFNLFHLLAEANGQEPVVIRNDEPGWKISHLEGFDNVVLSPGPGTPERPEDFGICTEIVRAADRPVLGVCLGHQGIAHLGGGSVRRAPEPRHGRVSPVEHSGTDLFAGIPSPFDVVRYHSLTVDDLPEDVFEATAWAPGGILMGLRHRERPLWGVQFHPESISSEHGLLMMRNFRDLTARWQEEHPAARPLAPAVPAPGPARPAPSRHLRVLTERLPTRWDPEIVFDELLRGGNHAFWLDSSRSDGATGRFSIMGDASGDLARVATADVAAGTVTVVSEREGVRSARIERRPFFDWIDEDLKSLRVDLPDRSENPCNFALGWVGYLGYELKAQCGAGPVVHRSRQPDATMVFAARALAFDHLTGTTHLLALAPADPDADGPEALAQDASARAWLRTTAGRLRALAGRTADPDLPAQPVDAGDLSLRHDRDAYLERIRRSQEDIAAGETYEVCLTNELHSEAKVDPWEGYRFLRRTSPAPFASLLLFGELAVLSTSPERFLRVTAEGLAESKPIKGTRPRGATAEEDEALRADLRTNEKDRSENLMIVDLVRNDLGRCAEVGSVHVPKLFDVETFATVHQLVSTVRATMRPGVSAVECVRTAFPGGSMTGAPKIRTMQIIDELEEGPRGVYSGAIGYFSLCGGADLSIVIRTAVVTEEGIRYGVGGAIVALSDPADEYEETITKTTPLLRLLGRGFPGRDGAASAESAASR
ncbi:aminodeoxychorismate synthase component I (plasmid) [Streptomyces sp. NBC_00335]|uniref:aminodeoxychorismate synthase component I n=1 Tax=unclassified Streptomyces TaxID=2593676 RepID=UPI00224E186B|nr:MULTISPECIES: aminodeoxychorismate synthase component I [unclassified Streptomyces]MCX5410047.1 aminodeoxychorismate synthase component I [Streptomyces sp. NBC_00086]